MQTYSKTCTKTSFTACFHVGFDAASHRASILRLRTRPSAWVVALPFMLWSAIPDQICSRPSAAPDVGGIEHIFKFWSAFPDQKFQACVSFRMPEGQLVHNLTLGDRCCLVVAVVRAAQHNIWSAFADQRYLQLILAQAGPASAVEVNFKTH